MFAIPISLVQGCYCGRYNKHICLVRPGNIGAIEKQLDPEVDSLSCVNNRQTVF